MRIVSIIKDSFQEYQGCQALVFFCAGCNLRCAECYNLMQVLTTPPIGSAYDLLDRHVTPMHEAVVFLGGEPLIWRAGLKEALIKARGMGLKTKIYTNGLLRQAVLEINKYVDAWSVDFKCLHDTQQVLGIRVDDYVSRVCETIDLCRSKTEIRTTKWDCVANQIDDIKAYVATRYPDVPHIIQDKWRGKIDERAANR